MGRVTIALAVVTAEPGPFERVGFPVLEIVNNAVDRQVFELEAEELVRAVISGAMVSYVRHVLVPACVGGENKLVAGSKKSELLGILLGAWLELEPAMEVRSEFSL